MVLHVLIKSTHLSIIPVDTT